MDRPRRAARLRDTVPQLKELCLHTLRHHVAGVSDVGDLPYQVVAPVLAKCGASQLAMIEDNSPHLTDGTNELWHALAQRQFPQATRDARPAPKSWRTFFEEQLRAEEAAFARQSERQREDQRQERRQARQREIQTLELHQIPQRGRRTRRSSAGKPPVPRRFRNDALQRVWAAAVTGSHADRDGPANSASARRTFP